MWDLTGFRTLIKNTLFPSPTNVESHNKYTLVKSHVQEVRMQAQLEVHVHMRRPCVENREFMYIRAQLEVHVHI